jgi:hypothetical protein
MIGLAIWLVVPIMGIFFLLFSIQLNLLRVKKTKQRFLSLNQIILFIVILTISIYTSSFEVFADTQQYLKAYEDFGVYSPLDNYYSQRYEFVLFLFAYPIYLISNGSSYWFLFIYSFFVNSFLVFQVAQKISNKYYPLFLIILFSTFMYYSQIFYMRQFLSITFLMGAIASLEGNIIWLIIYCLLSIFSHLTGFIYVAILLAVKFRTKFLFFSNKIRISVNHQKILKYTILILLSIIFTYLTVTILNTPDVIYRWVEQLLNYIPIKELSTSFIKRLDAYDGRDIETFTLTLPRILGIAGVGCLIVLQDYRNLSSRTISLTIIYIISILQIIFILITGFNQRIAYLFLTFYGLFFSIGISEKKDKMSKIFWVIAIAMALLNVYNIFGVQKVMYFSPGWSFFEGKPLEKTIYEYLLFFVQSI